MSADLDGQCHSWQTSEKRHNQRIAIAARIAAGMAANPEIYQMKAWQGEIARNAWEVAGRLLLLAESGGC